MPNRHKRKTKEKQLMISISITSNDCGGGALRGLGEGMKKAARGGFLWDSPAWSGRALRNKQSGLCLRTSGTGFVREQAERLGRGGLCGISGAGFA